VTKNSTIATSHALFRALQSFVLNFSFLHTYNFKVQKIGILPILPQIIKGRFSIEYFYTRLLWIEN